jgi:hypothetical protein
MAMTKAEQYAASQRILAKEPLTEEELAILHRNTRVPPYIEDVKELAEHRECKVCGAEFFSGKEAMALEQYADHSSEHNPTPGQWAEAHRSIQRGKERKKGEEQ